MIPTLRAWGRCRPSPPAIPPSRIAARGLAGFGKSWFRDCPRDEHGRCLPRGEAARASRPGERGRSKAEGRSGPRPRPRSKSQGRLARFRATAVRRRVLHGLRNEGELADAIGALNLPDSEPADVVLLVGPTGEIISDGEQMKRHLRSRELAVGLLTLGHWGPDGRPAAQGTPAGSLALDSARRILAQPLVFFECKTLVTAAVGKVRMSAAAVARKRRWEEKYAARFVTVAFDDRRGHKYSGHRLYFRNGIGTARLDNMELAEDFEDVLLKATGGTL